MPCAKAMTGCKASCLHRASVCEYRLARAAQERERDDRTSMGRGEMEIDAENGRRLLTFKDWLVGLACIPAIGYDDVEEQVDTEHWRHWE